MRNMSLPQSKNFFAALDDSGDEGPAPAKPVQVEKKKESKPKPQQKVVEASQVDPKYVSKFAQPL
jgi:anti-sigma factor RsiW